MGVLDGVMIVIGEEAVLEVNLHTFYTSTVNAGLGLRLWVAPELATQSIGVV